MHRTAVSVSAALVTTALVTAACGSSGSSGGSGGKTYRIKYSTQWNTSFPIVQADKKFVQQVEKDSGGRIKVTLYPNGVLGGAEGTVTGVRNGSIQMGAVASTWIATGVPKVGALSLPFLFPNSDKMAAALDNDTTVSKQLNSEAQSKLGVNILGWYTIGVGSIFTTGKTINSPADMSGVKMRSDTNPISVNTLKALGSVPTPLNNTETFSGLQSGTVSGLILSPLNVKADKYDEVLKHALLVPAQPFPAVMLINSKFFSSLPPDLQAIITKDAAAANAAEIKVWNAQEAAAISQMKSSGVALVTPTAQQLIGFKNATKPVYAYAEKQFGADFVDQLVAAGQ